jgi:DNA-binding ferritin-like protein
MTTSIAREHTVDVANPSDSAGLRKHLCTILTHLVDLHVKGKQADALFIGVGSAALHLHFHGVVETALEAIELVADRVRALDSQSVLNGRTQADGCGRPSRAEPPAADVPTAAVDATAGLIIRRIVTLRAVVGAVHNGIRDDDPLTAALLCRVDRVLEAQEARLPNLSVDLRPRRSP